MSSNSLALRREARKRRILENSESRLRRITGSYEEKATKCELDDLCSGEDLLNGPISTVFREKKINGPSRISARSCISDQLQCDAADGAPVFEGEEEEEEEQSVSQLLGKSYLHVMAKNEVSAKSFFYICKTTRLHFACLAVCVRLLYSLDCAFLFGESIFIPLFIMEVFDMIMGKEDTYKPSSTTKVVGTVLLISGISPSRIAMFTNCIGVLTKFGKDISVYFVSFVTFHTLLGWPG